jgi:hypothetical protein
VLPAGKVAVITGALAVQCEKTTFTGEQENTGGATETIKIKGTVLTNEECEVPGVCQSATVPTNTQPTLEIHNDGTTPDNGTETVKGFTITAVCGAITCKYSGEVQPGLTIKGGNPATLIATKAPIPVEDPAKEAFFCGKFAEWDAEYEITTPKPLWIV